MKKWMRIILIIAGCLAAAGIVLDLLVLAVHGFNVEKMVKKPDLESAGLVEHSVESLYGDYQRIEFTSGSMDVFVETGDVDKVQVFYREKMDWLREGEDTLLTLTDKGDGVLGVSYAPDRSLPYDSTLTFGFYEDSDATQIGVWITLPRSFKGTLDFQCGSGDMNITGLDAAGLAAISGSGCISVGESKFQSVDLQTGSGDVYLWELASPGKIGVHTGSGGIDSREIDAAELECSAGSGSVILGEVEVGTVALDTSSGYVSVYGLGCDTLYVTTGSGDQYLEQVDASHILLNAGSGCVDIYLFGAYDDYQFALEPQSGDCRIYDENGNEIHRTHSDSASRTLEVTTGSGDIVVTFLGAGAYTESLG